MCIDCIDVYWCGTVQCATPHFSWINLADDETIMFCGNMEVVFHDDTALPHSRCGHRKRWRTCGWSRYHNCCRSTEERQHWTISVPRSEVPWSRRFWCVESLTPKNMQDSCCSAFCIHLDWVWFLDPADSFHPRNIMGKEWDMMING